MITAPKEPKRTNHLKQYTITIRFTTYYSVCKTFIRKNVLNGMRKLINLPASNLNVKTEIKEL